MPDINSLDIKKILIIDLAFIGDVVLATPVTRAIRSRWPQAEITMLTVPLTKPVAEMNPYVDQVLVCDKRGRHKGITGMLAMARELKQYSFDLAICMNFALRGAVIAWLAGIPYRLGYDAQWAGLFLTWQASHIRDGIKHETRNHLEVLKPFGITAEDYSLKLEAPQEARDSYDKLAEKYGWQKQGYYVVCPFGSYERKDFPLTIAAPVIAQLEKKLPVYLIGGKKEAEGLEILAETARLPGERILAGTLTLQQLAVFLANAKAMVSVDTGPMHIAQAVNCPTVALFGPTDPAIWGTCNANSQSLYFHEDCSPCWGKGECLKNNDCMSRLQAKTILETLESVSNK